MPNTFEMIWQDLARRRVFRVAAVYVAVAWVMVQVAGEVVPALYLPSWIITAIVILLILGFPVACILAWLFDLGPKGVARTRAGSATGIVVIGTSIAILIGATALFVALIVPEPDFDRPVPRSEAFTPIAHSVAVLPFVDMSPDGNFGYFGDGIAETLIHQLAQIGGLHVISRTSSFSFRDDDIDIREIGRELEVGQVLEGSVQRAGGKLRIAAQLIDTRTGVHVWSKIFDRPEDDVFSIQDEIALSVAGAMEVDVAPDTAARITRSLHDSLDAYDYYLLGMHGMYNSLDMNQTRRFFEKAIEVDPEHAIGYAGLAKFYAGAAFDNDMPVADALDTAMENIEKALAIDPQLTEAYVAAVSVYNVENDLEKAKEAFDRAIVLSPSNAEAMGWYGNLLMQEGLFDQAETIFRRALSLDPFHIPSLGNMSWLLSLRGMNQESFDILVDLERRQLHEDTWPEGVAYLAMNANEPLGRTDIAIALAQFVVTNAEVEADTLDAMMVLVESYVDIGEKDAALHWINSLLSQESIAWYHYMTIARAFLVVDDPNLAATAMQQVRDNFDADDSGHVGFFYAYIAAKDLIYDHNCVAADEYLDHAVASAPGQFWLPVNSLLAYCQQALGEIGDFESTIAAADEVEARESTARDSLTLLSLAELRAMNGQTDEAMAFLWKAYNNDYIDPVEVAHSPTLDSLRDESEFHELLDAIEERIKPMRENVIAARETGDWSELLPLDLSSRRKSN